MLYCSCTPPQKRHILVLSSTAAAGRLTYTIISPQHACVLPCIVTPPQQALDGKTDMNTSLFPQLNHLIGSTPVGFHPRISASDGQVFQSVESSLSRRLMDKKCLRYRTGQVRYGGIRRSSASPRPPCDGTHSASVWPSPRAAMPISFYLCSVIRDTDY